MKVADAKIAQNTELIGLIQKRLRNTLANSEFTEVAQIKGELQEIYSTKDLEILLSVLKGDKDDKLLQAIEQEVQNSNASSPNKPSQ